MYSVKQFILGPEHEYLAVSRGIENMDLSEIRSWSPSNGELVSPSLMAHSWNFHPLPTGCFCLSRTGRLATLFPKENPANVFTHGILIPADLLHDYANNPVTFLNHLEKLGLWRAGMEVTRQLIDMKSDPEIHTTNENFPGTEILPILRTLTMDGGAEAVRLEALNAFVRTTGIRRFATILDQLLGNFTTIITGNAVPEMLLEALLDLLPVSCRPEFSFSTGLKFSQKRLFRLVFAGNNSSEQERIRHHFNLPMISSTSVSLMQDQLLPSLKNRWSMFIATLFEQGMETAWNEIALLEDTASLSDLPRIARTYFKRLGLEEIYQRIREQRRETPWNTEIYGIFQTRVNDRNEALRAAAPLLNTDCGLNCGMNPVQEFEKKTDSEADRVSAKDADFKGSRSNGTDSNVPKSAEIPPATMNLYLATLSEAIHGNPLAQNHLREVYQEITMKTPDVNRDEISEILLREGIRCWNHLHESAPNQSWRQVENMVDTLSTMLNLWEDGETMC